jgi:hypothetical protein
MPVSCVCCSTLQQAPHLPITPPPLVSATPHHDRVPVLHNRAVRAMIELRCTGLNITLPRMRALAMGS